MTQKPVVRLGALSFLNAYPFRIPPSEMPEALDLQITTGTPAELNAAMERGELDVSLVSSAYYLRHQSRLTPLADLSISSSGPTESVYLALPAQSHWGDRIAVPQTSETSVALAAYWLQEQTHSQAHPHEWPVYQKGESALWLQQGVPTLLIGDEALAHRLDLSPDGGETVIDLGEWWHQKTGLPFVFAVWVAQKSFAQQHPQCLRSLEALLQRKKQAFYQNQATQGQVLAQAFEDFAHWPQTLIQHYLTQVLTYNLQDAEAQGLAQFAQVLQRLDRQAPCPQEFAR